MTKLTKQEQCTYCRYVECPCFEHGKLAGKKEFIVELRTFIDGDFDTMTSRKFEWFLEEYDERFKSQLKDSWGERVSVGSVSDAIQASRTATLKPRNPESLKTLIPEILGDNPHKKKEVINDEKMCAL
jgi:hypothetical protein